MKKIKIMKFSKYILLFILCYCVPTLSEAQKVAGFQGKRGVIEVGLMPVVGVRPTGFRVQMQGTIHAAYAISNQISIGAQYDKSRFSGLGSLTTYGLSGELASTKYSLAPYGRFWTVNIGVANFNTDMSNYEGYYFTCGFYDRSIWRPISLTWGSDIGLYSLDITGSQKEEFPLSPMMIRLFVRVGLVW